MCEDYWLGDIFESVRRSALCAIGNSGTELRAAVAAAPDKDAMRHICREYALYACRVSQERTHPSERSVYHQVGKLIETWDRIVHETPELAEKMRSSAEKQDVQSKPANIESLI